MSDADKTLPHVSKRHSRILIPTVRLLFDGNEGPINSIEKRLGKFPVVIGRGADPRGIKLSDPMASRKHANITCNEDGREVYLKDTSSNGTFVNGQRITTAILGDGDIVRVGNSFLMIRHHREEIEDTTIDGIIGDSPSMKKLRRTIAKVAPTDAVVLITGESGTGKELVAKAIHELSGCSGPFIPVNCGAIPATLAESHLFGHVAGSFTGAQDAHQGFFKQAEGGTLFLDEVGELPAEIQPKFLRVLEERKVIPVGGTRYVPVGIRVVAATNRDLEVAISSDQFRGDLFARLAEFTIRTPLLVEHKEDILPLFMLGFGGELPKLDASLVEELFLNRWRFNVRELFKVARELSIKGGVESGFYLSPVQQRLFRSRADDTPNRNTLEHPRDHIPFSSPAEMPASERSAQVEKKKEPVPSREEVEELLGKCKGNISKLSRLLGRSRRQVYRYLDMYDLSLDDFRD